MTDRAAFWSRSYANLPFGLQLCVTLDFDAVQAGMSPISIDGIEREPVTYAPGQRSYRWRLPVNGWGEITFESPGFTQECRAEAKKSGSQCLTASERCG